MSNPLIEKLVRAMREYLPKDENLAAVLMDVLCLSKEASYRRLRGDIMFTFEDVAKISRRFGFSLDKIVGESMILDNNKWAYTDIETFYSSSKYIEQYTQQLRTFSKMFHEVSNQSKAVFRIATSYLPYHFVLPYRNLTLFRHYKRAYLTLGLNPEFRFADFEKPSNAQEEEEQILKMCLKIPKHILILEEDIFYSIIKDINYFYHRQLLSESEFLQLKKELLGVLSYMEKIAATGMFETGTEILIYLLDVELDASYVHLESEDFEYSLLCSYYVELFSFYNSKVCQRQKHWIDSLKRYSTLISQTGEKHRVDFFKKQREMIWAM